MVEPTARDGGEHARPRQGDRHSRAADPDADGGQDSEDAQPQIAESPVRMPQVMVPKVVREAD